MAGPTLPVVFPFQLHSAQPDGNTESCRLLDERIIEVAQQVAKLLGYALDTNITGPLALNASLMGSVGSDCRWLSTTTFRLGAQKVITADANSHLKLHTNPANITNNIGTAGPTANGRDQAGAFAANSFVHFYWIYNPTSSTLATLSSASGPNPGPTLPAGYLLGAYAGAMRLDASVHLIAGNIRGRWTWYQSPQSELVGGNATVSTAIDCSSSVPPAAISMRGVSLLLSLAGGGPETVTATITDYLADVVSLQSIKLLALSYNADQTTWVAPNYSQGLKYYLSAADGGTTLSVSILGFENPTCA